MPKKNNIKQGSGSLVVGFTQYQPEDRPIKGLDNGVLARYGSTDPASGSSYGERSNLNFPGAVAFGENPTGFSSITPNGVQKQSDRHDCNSNYRWSDGTSGNRWNKNRPWDGDLSGN